jgi:hypothetical protein
MIYKLEEVNRRFPGVVPGRGVKVGNLALAIAMKIADYSMDKGTFEKVLIGEHAIEKEFPAGWGRADALARWYALGFICVTDCFRRS